MVVVRRADDDRVDFLSLLVQHLAEILIASRVGEALERFVAAHPVDIRERHYVL